MVEKECKVSRVTKLVRFVPLLVPILWHNLQAATVSVLPDADAFVRSVAPSANYGGAGAIAISGSTAVNGANETNGVFDSLIRFSMSNVVAALDATLNSHDWLVLRARLHLTEVGSPPSPMFNRGKGGFEVRLITGREWIEGTGIPVQPTTDGVVWNDLLSLLNPGTDVVLGQFTNRGIDGELVLDLALPEIFLSRIQGGVGTTFYLTASDPQTGFTAGSRTFFVSSGYPALEITAEANPYPRIDSIQQDGTNISVNFGTVSNWTYTLQYSEELQPNLNSWSNAMVVPAQPTNSHVIFQTGVTNSKLYYRLALSR